ncbi:MAG: IS66 family insertion sequence element accessory protein TnpB [Oscillospiraceae bacterium]|nr:IS66 family insertion sequence element accessory protein TnpB [Oscillospiraceae bacterium]
MEDTTKVIATIKNEVQLQKWSEEIRLCTESGMKVKEWCTLNGVNIKTYYYHLRKVRESICKAEPYKQTVVPIRTTDMKEQNQEQNILIKNHNVSVSLPSSIDPNFLIRLAKELSAC